MSDPAAVIPPGAEASAPPPRRDSWWRWLLRLPLTMARNARDTWREHKILFIALLFGLAFTIAYFWHDIVVKVGSGESAVLYRLFRNGTVVDRVYEEGIWFVAPWNTMTIYNVRVQQVADEFIVLSQDGLEVKVSVSTRFNPQLKELGLLHKHFGPDYVEKIVKPEVQAAFRHVIGQYTPDQIYTSAGSILQTVKQSVLAELMERLVVLDDVLLKSIQLPPSVAASIEAKLRAQQMSHEMDYRIDTETKEARRKEIEAGGIRAFQDAMMGSGGISPDFLKFKGIEATLELAKSANAKVIVVGGADRLPLIFDGTTTAPLVPPAATATPAPRATTSGPAPTGSPRR